MADFQAKSDNAAEFRTALQIIMPGASAREVQRFFRGLDLRMIGMWKTGKRWPADWAVQMLYAELDKVTARAATTKARLRSGPGLKGNRANLKPFRQAA